MLTIKTFGSCKEGKHTVFYTKERGAVHLLALAQQDCFVPKDTKGESIFESELMAQIEKVEEENEDTYKLYTKVIARP